MARDAQSFTIGDNTAGNNTKVDYILLQGGGVGVFPVARVVFRGAATLDGSGAGDTADCRITLPLPSDNVWQMDSFAFHTEDTFGYSQNLLEMYVAPSTTAFGQSTQVNFPISRFSGAQPGGTTLSSFYGIAGQPRDTSGNAIEAMMKFEDPFRIITFNDVSAGADPVIWLSSGTNTNIGSGTIRLVVSFLAYTFEQMSDSSLWVGS
jgi:hypothetical protein